jgi:hypothetical protein
MYNFINIVNHFNNAATKLKYPKLKLTHPVELTLKLAGSNSKYPGSITVTNGHSYGSSTNIYYGRIAPDGEFIPSAFYLKSKFPSTYKGVLELLVNLNTNITKVALTYYKATSNCMFCGKPIMTNESLTVGYGPICAEKWGLPWGEVEKDTSKTEKPEQLLLSL